MAATAVPESWQLGRRAPGKTHHKRQTTGLCALRHAECGGLVLTAKAEETQNWIAYAKACGREKDLIIFNADSGHSFDPLALRMDAPGPGRGGS